MTRYPLLNNAAENAKSRSPNSSGAVGNLDLFKVRVDLNQYDQVVRSFVYSNCRVTSYQIDTQLDKAEGYLNKTGFAILNYYSFECQGYTPINPPYDEMHKSQNTETTQNSLTMPQRSFDTWDDRFIAKKNQGN